MAMDGVSFLPLPWELRVGVRHSLPAACAYTAGADEEDEAAMRGGRREDEEEEEAGMAL